MIFHAIRKCATLGALTLGLCSQTSMAQTNKVVGYIPSYTDMRSVVDRTDLSKLTHINLAFANPTPSGAVASGTNPLCMLDPSGNTNVTGLDIAYVVNKAHAAGVKVSVSVAGGGLPPCSGNWRTLLSNNRQAVVNNYVQFVNSSNLDGIDIDIEGDLLTSIDSDGNYTPFIQALKNALPGKLVTSATANYEGGMIPESSFPYFDFVNLMSYDKVGPWSSNTGEEQSSNKFASDSIELWVGKGLPKSKIVLGVPFYGYGFGTMPESITYAGILAQYGETYAQVDYVGSLCAGCSYITYNGIPTIRKKALLAKDNIAGIMIWELSQDVSGSNSLLAAIASVMGPKTNSSSSVASSVKSSSSSIKSSTPSSVASSVKSSAVASSVKPSSSSVASSSSSSVAGGQQCNWWGTYYAICTKVNSGWGWENNKDCVSASTCATLPAPYGIVGTASSSVASSVKNSVASSIKSSVGASSVKSSSVASSTPKSSSSSSSSVAAFSLLVQAEAYANMSGVQLETTNDVDGALNVGWIDTGDWLAYNNIVIPTSGSYRIDYRVASLPGGGILAANLNTNAIQFPAVAIPSTGDWQKWTTVSQTVNINAGTYTFGLYASAGNWNINWIKFTKL